MTSTLSAQAQKQGMGRKEMCGLGRDLNLTPYLTVEPSSKPGSKAACWCVPCEVQVEKSGKGSSKGQKGTENNGAHDLTKKEKFESWGLVISEMERK